MNCLVSVIIPVYNVEKYLAECIKSVINQTYNDLEIILVDDGSKDDSGIICDKFANEDKRIKVVHKENGGLSSARNVGIKQMKGKYVFFLDSDDYILDNTIETLMKYKDDKLRCIVSCDFADDEKELQGNSDDDWKFYTKKEAWISLLKEKEFKTSACAKLFSASLFDNIRFPEGRNYEDYATIYKIVDESDRIIVLNEKKYYYRFNDESITKKRFNETRMEYFKVAKEIIDYCRIKHKDLVQLAINHRTRMAISYYKQISSSSYENEIIEQEIVMYVKKDIFHYLFSCYKIKSKLYGVLICLSPIIARKIFDRS